MVVVPNLREAHGVRDTQRLVDLLSGLHAPVGSLTPKPLLRRVLNNIQSSGGNQPSKHMMIKRKIVYRGLSKRLKGLGEPNILRNNLGSSLDVLASLLHGIRKPPACRTARSRFLGNGKSEAWLECTSHHGTLAVSGASSNTDFGRVDPSSRCNLKGINDSTHTPGPSGHSRGRVSATVEGVELALASGGGALLSPHVVVVERNDCDPSRTRNAQTTIGDDSRIRSSTGRWISDCD